MKKPLYLLLFAACIGTATAQTNFYDYSAASILGDTIHMLQYTGKKLMIVNTASKCGFTPQYEQLQDLYSQYKQYGFEIIGFPCNDFGKQEAGSDSTINEFCSDVYGVTFQMMSKVAVVSTDTAPIYKWLQRGDLNGVQNAHVDWNFNKFLIGRNGEWVRHVPTATLPTDASITSWIVQDANTGVGPRLVEDLLSIMSSNPVISSLQLTAKSNVKDLDVNLYSLDGRLVNTVYSGNTTPGQVISYPVSNMAAGIYMLHISADGLNQSTRITIAR